MSQKMSRMLMVVAVVAVGFCVSAFAGNVGVTFDGSGGQVAGGNYIYPYYLNINGSKITVICDDYNDDVYPGEQWTASVNTFSDLSHTLFASQTNSTQEYEEAAWLLSQISSHPNDTAGIQYAIWDLFTPSAPGYGSGQNSSSYWLNLASQQDFTNFDFSSFIIYTPVSWNACYGRPQEYITETPEPATIALFGAAALLLLGMGWKRRRNFLAPIA